MRKYGKRLMAIAICATSIASTACGRSSDVPVESKDVVTTLDEALSEISSDMEATTTETDTTEEATTETSTTTMEAETTTEIATTTEAETTTEAPTTTVPETTAQQETTTAQPTTEAPTTTQATASSAEKILNGASLNPVRSDFEPMNEYIDQLFAEIIKDNMTTYQKVKACYDYLINNCSYGMNEYVYDYIEYYFWGYQYEVSAYGMLKGHVGVCDDYSATFAMLMQAIGLDCYVVGGQTSKAGGGYTGHAWCEMNIGGTIYVFDPQVEDNIANGGTIKYYRFCKTYGEVPNKYIKSE